MERLLKRAALLTVACFVFAAISLAQTGAFSGKVIGEDGKPLQNAMIKIERKDIRGNYQVKTNKKGEYFHAGLPLGTYKISVEVNGAIKDSMDNVRTSLGDPKEVNFDLAAIAQKQAALQKAAESGTLTAEQSREMSAEQKAAFEKANKERQQQLAKNKALSDAFNNAMNALNAKDFQTANDNFAKAAELDPKQHVVWANWAETMVAMAKTKAGPERDQALEKAFEYYGKALELKADDAGMHNNYALALALAKKFPEAQAELQKAATLDPANGGKYYYNLGAVMVNTGQSEAAVEAFKKAIEMDPNYADAQYQYGNALSAKISLSPDGKMIAPPGMREALEKYLQLKPDGPYAESAKGLLQAIEGTVATKYENPDAKKNTKGKKK